LLRKRGAVYRRAARRQCGRALHAGARVVLGRWIHGGGEPLPPCRML